MKLNNPTVARWMSGVVLLAALFFIATRGGLIAWVTGVAALVLLAQQRWRPSRWDLGRSIALGGLATMAWVGAWYYVITTYESGEVVELAVDTEDGTRAVRLWVMALPDAPAVYIDAEPGIAESLLAGKPVRLTRAGVTSTRVPRTKRVDGMSDGEADVVYQAMANKYGQRMTASDLYYILLGRPHDRVALLVSLPEAR
ncbi:MAG: hypothetical protein H6994_18705 [Pseudomonadales bacterium]|nr:hypothetical protein [Pseudomonadales bacterium]